MVFQTSTMTSDHKAKPGSTQPCHPGDPQQRKQPVDDSEIEAQQDAPDEPDDDVGHEHRQQQQDEGCPSAPEGLVEQGREPDAQHQLEHQGCDQEGDRDLQRMPEARIVDGLDVVVQAHEWHALFEGGHLPLMEAQIQAVGDGYADHRQDGPVGWQQERPRAVSGTANAGVRTFFGLRRAWFLGGGHDA